VNGPGGCFGLDLASLVDCCMGGLGASPPFTVRWQHVSLSRARMGHGALRHWADERLQRADFLDTDGRAWLERTRDQAAWGQGLTLFGPVAGAACDLGLRIDEA
jgi:hypothetical protein